MNCARSRNGICRIWSPRCRRSIWCWSKVSSATLFPKLEIHRIANGKPLIHPEDPHIVAVASDSPVPEAKVPVIDLNNIDAIADLLLEHAVPVGDVARATA